MPEKIEIHVKGSKGDIYTITALFENKTFTIKCNCPAGRFGNFCKHKLACMKGQEYILLDDDDEDYENLQRIADWVQKSEGLDLITRMSELQREQERIKAELTELHKEAATAMRTGLRVR